MAERSVCVSTVSFAVTENMQKEKVQQKRGEAVELAELKLKREEKIPRRIIHFSTGETMEEYSSEDEDEDTDQTPRDRSDPLSPGGQSRLPWGPYVMLHMWRAATSSLSACDYVGERMASLLGITTAKYQYAIDQHARKQKQGGVSEENQGEELSPAPPGSD